MHSMIVYIIYSSLLFAAFRGCYSVTIPPRTAEKSTSGDPSWSSIVFPVTGNVYPKGYYHVTVHIGNPPKPYWLDIDTGSDLTWLQCDAPCAKCTPAPHKPYKPNEDLVACLDPLCTSVHWPENHDCESPKEQCDYQVEYADSGLSMGVLVKDWFPLPFTNGSIANPRLAFGCGYNQEVPGSMEPPFIDGILGLGVGKASILHQLRELGVTRNIVGHCLNAQGGYMFFGDKVVPSSGVTWTPMSTTSTEKHYSLGSAELHFGGKSSGIKGLPIVFDSGSTYTYFSSEAYNALVSMLAKDMKGKRVYRANDDMSLPVCWKGVKPFNSIDDVRSFFKPIMLSFAKFKNVRFQLDPENYIIITKYGNTCLGILNGTEVGLESVNVIGDISLQNSIIIYDNENQRIGWAPANCNKHPNMVEDADDDYDYDDGPGYGGLCKSYESNFGVLQGYCATTSKKVDK